MATIKDIAKAAGVSATTVSNVLNGRGNVSYKKICLVQQTAKDLSYRLNEAASTLRSGQIHSIALILPRLDSLAYTDLYDGIITTAQEKGYPVSLYVTYNNPEREKQILSDILSSRCTGVATVTSLVSAENSYRRLQEAGMQVIFAERADQERQDYIGFDVNTMALDMATRVLADGAKNIGMMTDMADYPNEQLFAKQFQAFVRSKDASVRVQYIHTVPSQYKKRAFQFLDAQIPDAIVATNEEMAQAILSTLIFCTPDALPRIYALSPTRSFYHKDYERYGLNYRLLGQTIAKRLTTKSEQEERIILHTDGFATRTECPAIGKKISLRLLTLACPHTVALKELSPQLSRTRGIDLDVVSLTDSSEINQVITQYGKSATFDLCRTDVASLGRMAQSMYIPLSELNLGITDIRRRMLPSLWDEFTSYCGKEYTLPADPSAMVLFYRKDMMEDTALQRAYYEYSRGTLKIPDTYEELVHESEFFSQGRSGNGRILFGSAMNGRGSEYIAHLSALGIPINVLTEEQLIDMLHCHRSLMNVSKIVPSQNWRTLVDTYCQGQSMFTMIYANHAETICSNPLSHVSGRIGNAVIPGKKPLLGGGVIGVSKFSEKKQAAADVLDWICSSEISRLIALISGTSAFSSDYEDEQILSIYPWIRTVRTSFETGKRRYLIPGADEKGNVREIEEQLGFHARNAMSGIVTYDQAAKDMLKILHDVR